MSGRCPSPSARSPTFLPNSIAWAKSRNRNVLRIFVAPSIRSHPGVSRSNASASSRDMGETAPLHGSHFLDASPIAFSSFPFRSGVSSPYHLRIATPADREHHPGEIFRGPAFSPGGKGGTSLAKGAALKIALRFSYTERERQQPGFFSFSRVPERFRPPRNESGGQPAGGSSFQRGQREHPGI